VWRLAINIVGVAACFSQYLYIIVKTSCVDGNNCNNNNNNNNNDYDDDNNKLH
jgi:hypothetical protein